MDRKRGQQRISSYGSHCDECGKTLEPHTCSTCSGTGVIKSSFLFKKKCPTCRGSAELMRCPDKKKHDHERERKVLRKYKDRFGPQTRQQPPIGVCNVCGGTGWIPGAVAPTTPDYWVKRRCPRCH